MKPLTLLSTALVALSPCSSRTAFADSATWQLNPVSSDWNTAANWTPNTVPNGPDDIATFALSNTSPSTREFIEVASIVFNPGASAFNIEVAPDTSTGHSASLTFSGMGVSNNSGTPQAFSVLTDGFSSGAIFFTGSATAGIETTFLIVGGSAEAGGGETQFLDDSNAGTAVFTGEGGEIGGSVQFSGNSSASDATFICQGAEFAGDFGSFIFFQDFSTAANATFIVNGGMARNAGGAFVDFLSGSPTAGNATLVANRGTGGGEGGSIFFSETSNGGAARVEVYGNGSLNVGLHEEPGLTIGSLEGDGVVSLGANNLTIGANNLSTTFDGAISGSGSLAKIGSGKLTLAGPNTYTGRTHVKQGKLFLEDRTGSLMVIPGSVLVDGGTFGGSGLIGGAVVVSSPSGRPAVLEPNQLHGGNFIIQKSLKFNPGATCNIDVNSNAGRYSSVWAKGVTISEGALFAISDSGNSSFGLVNLIMINNTGSTPIAGTFSNLPDGGTIVVGKNTYRANYHGGDGNDLLMMVNQ